MQASVPNRNWQAAQPTVYTRTQQQQQRNTFAQCVSVITERTLRGPCRTRTLAHTHTHNASAYTMWLSNAPSAHIEHNRFHSQPVSQLQTSLVNRRLCCISCVLNRLSSLRFVLTEIPLCIYNININNKYVCKSFKTSAKKTFFNWYPPRIEWISICSRKSAGLAESHTVLLALMFDSASRSIPNLRLIRKFAFDHIVF